MSRRGAAAARTPVKGRSRRVAPRPRVILGIALIGVFASLLLVHAYVSAEFTGDHVSTEEGEADRVPQSVITGGPIINTTGDQVRSHRLPPKTIALTFDDGPDPVWTPQVLRVLKENDVNGTFFVVGSQVARYPDLARRMAADGNELGVHTFTHPNLQLLPDWRRKLEYSMTQQAIARAAGVKSALIRFPYSSHAYAIDNPNWKLVHEAGDLGYLFLVNDTDSQDWARPGVAAIVRNATPAGDDPAVVLMHDAGGDRSQTVAALRQFIPAMKAKGYRFTTVSEGFNLAAAAAGATSARTVAQNPPAAQADRLRGTALLWTVRMADATIYLLAGIFLLVGGLTIGRTVLLLALATRHARQRRKKTWSWGPPVTDPVSVIVPAFNEKEGIEAAVRSLATGDHPHIEVVVVDDGSTDETAALAEGLGLPNVRVVRVPNGGKANALNTGVALARHDLIVMVDGDTIFEPDSVRRLVQPFANPKVGAVAGNVKVGNRGTMTSLWQHIEYVIGFNLDRRLYEVLRCMPTVPGAIGAFRRQALRAIGGMSDETLAEDTDVTIAMQRAGWDVVYEEHARAWTEAPASLSQLYKQRYRWSYGTMQAMWKHRAALVDRGASGRFGRVGLPFLALFGIALPLLAPVMDILMLYGLIFWGKTETVYAWLGMLVLQLLTAAIAFRFDRESVRPLWALPLQQLAYRQLMYLVLIQSVMSALTGAKLRWHKLQRTGLAGSPEPTMAAPGAVPTARRPEHGLATVVPPPPQAGPGARATVPTQVDRAQPAAGAGEHTAGHTAGQACDPWQPGDPRQQPDDSWQQSDETWQRAGEAWDRAGHPWDHPEPARRELSWPPVHDR